MASPDYRHLLQELCASDLDRMAAMRHLGRTDLFYLLVHLLHRTDVDRPWLEDRCREVQASPDGHLDLWSREHYKSTIVTFGKTIQDILVDPEVTVGIFSHTRPIAKAFLRQIKGEFEANELLKALFPEVLWADPRREAPRWSEDSGIVVKRQNNPKESTVEAWGLVDGQPTSKHFSLQVYDDVVTRESVTTPEMIHKTTEAWELSLNLGAEGGRRRYIGTRYHFNDTYRTMLDRGAAVPRIYPAVDAQGVPVLLSRESLDAKRRDMGPYIFGCQMLQDPAADTAMGFKQEWLRYWDAANRPAGWNIYILCDPASSKKAGADFTVFMVVALAHDGNTYVLDIVRDRLNLTERTNVLMALHRKYQPHRVGYERYGMQADVEHIRSVQERENYRVEIVELGGQVPKVDRIRRLVPDFEQGRIYLPVRTMYIDTERRTHDLTAEFVNEEYLAFPVSVHDDMLDCLSRIKDADLCAMPPMRRDAEQYSPLAEHDWDPLAEFARKPRMVA